MIARSSTWSCVMTSTCAPSGRSASAASGTGSVRTRTVATASPSTPLVPGTPIRSGASISARESTRSSSIGWRARMRASSRPTWPRPKIATDGTTRTGSSSMVTSPPQHCTPYSVVALSLSVSVSSSGSAAPSASISRARWIAGRLEVAAADGAEAARRPRPPSWRRRCAARVRAPSPASRSRTASAPRGDPARPAPSPRSAPRFRSPCG